MSSKRVLVLGAGGRVGRLLRGSWSALKTQLLPVYQTRAAKSPGDVVIDPMLASQKELRAAFAAHEAAGMVVLWGVTVPTRDTPLSLNTTLALKALVLARDLGLAHVILMSSAAIYLPTIDARPFRESDDPVPPASEYGLAKRAMEAAVRTWHDCHSTAETVPAVTVIRLGNVVGADMLSDSIRTFRPGYPLKLDRFRDGTTPRRSYLSPRSLAIALDDMLQEPSTKTSTTFNLADMRHGVEMQEILSACRDLGRDVDWQHQAAPETAIRSVVLDSTQFLERYPRAGAHFRSSAADLVADWLDVED